MKRIDKIWVAIWAVFWFSLIITFLIDYLGIIETSNIGFVETLWISWIAWSVVLGVAMSVLTRLISKD